jgi:hypothetical protein
VHHDRNKIFSKTAPPQELTENVQVDIIKKIKKMPSGRRFLMGHYNYKVVAELRPDLPKNERENAVNTIRELQKKLHIVNIDTVTYCKEQPIHGYDDFGAVAFFFSALKDMKDCFLHLEYYDLWEDRKRVAV